MVTSKGSEGRVIYEATDSASDIRIAFLVLYS
jgi:hypothetical protein